MMTLNKTTGQMVELVRTGWKIVHPAQRLRYAVVGLTAENRDTSIRFTFTRQDEITEPDAIDAQCRAGWDDQGYGFWGLSVEKTEAGYVATWACGKSSD